MSRLPITLLIGLPALTASLLAAAQAPQPAPAASAPAAHADYRSAFDGYRPFVAEEVQDWRRSNDTVRDIGGWRAYAREVHGDPQRPQGAAADQPKAADPHAGHH